MGEKDHYKFGIHKSAPSFVLWLIRDKRGIVWRYVGGNPVIYYRRKDAAEAAKKLDPMPGYKAVRAELIVCQQSDRGGVE